MLENNIQVASRLCGVGVHTLRAWEKRYAAVVPQRSNTGRRLYSDEDISKLQMLNELCRYGNSISSIANYSNEELGRLLAKFTKQEKSYSFDAEVSIGAKEEGSRNALSHLVLALDTSKLDVISHELAKLVRILNPKDLVHNVLSPLLDEISSRYEQGSITYGQELSILSLMKFHVSEILYNAFRQSPRGGKIFVFATPDSIKRELGILCCALIASNYRHKNFYFGNNLPVDALCQTTEALGADYVILDTSHVSSDIGEECLHHYLTKLIYKLNQKQKFILFGDDPFVTDYLKKSGQFKLASSFEKFDDLVRNI